MKRILALAYLGFMLFSLSSTAENAISINILGNEQEDARFYFLECREEILNETKYKIFYKSANITVEDLSLLTNREYDAVLLYQKVLQAAVETSARCSATTIRSVCRRKADTRWYSIQMQQSTAAAASRKRNSRRSPLPCTVLNSASPSPLHRFLYSI